MPDDYRNTYNSTSAPLGSLTAGGSATGNIEIGGDADVFAVTLVAGRTYIFDLKGSPGGGGTLSDTYLTLLNSSGGYLTGNSNANGSNDSQVIFTAATTGTYYLSAAADYSTLTGTYTLFASAGFVDDYRDRYDDTVEALGSLAPGGSRTGTLEIGGDIDVFAITLTAGRTYTFDLKGAPGGGGTLTDSYMTLLNASGGYLTGNSNAAGTNDSRIVYTATTTGTFYLTAAADYSNLTGSYTLSADSGYIDDYRDTYADTLETLGAVSPGTSKTGNIEIGGDVDVFAISLTAGRTYTFDLKGAPGGGGTLSDTYLTLLNASGGYLTGNSNAAGTNDSRIVYTATTTGTFYLSAAADYSNLTGTYTLSANAGYIDDYRDTYADTLEALGSLATGGSKTGTLEIGGDADVFAVTLTAGRTYTFDLRGSPSGGGTLTDTYLTLLNASGGYLTGNSNASGSTTDSRIVYTANVSGTYYLTAAADYGKLTGTYTLSASSGFNDDYRDTYADTLEALGNVTPGGSSTGHIEDSGDKDVFAVNLVAGKTYSFDLKGSPTGAGTLTDTYLTLLNGSGGFLASNSNASGSTTDSRITFTAATSGTYYLTAAADSAGLTGTYTLSASSGYVDDYRDTYNSTVEALGALTVGGSATGTLEMGGDADVFAVTLTAGQTYTFKLRGSASGGGTLSDPGLLLSNATGGFLASNGNGAGTTDSEIVYTATASGTYYLTASGDFTNLTGTYTLSAASAPTPDDYRDVYNDAAKPLGALAVGGTANGIIGSAGDRDVFAITLAAGQTYTFDLSGSSTAGTALANGELRLLDGTGAVLRTNDDFNGPGARIVFTAGADGTYYLDARSHTAATGGYALSARGGFDDARDSIGDTTAELITLTQGGTRLGTIETSGDRDVYAVTLTAGQTYTFDVAGSSAGGSALANPEFRLLGTDGAVLRSNDDFNGSSGRIVFTAGATGTYYLDITSHLAGGTGTYAVTSQVNFDDARDSIADSSAALTTLGSATRLGTIETGGDVDVFAVTLTAGKSYTFDLKGFASAAAALNDGELRLLDGSGTVLRLNDNFNSRDSRIVFTATASGTYYLDVRSHLSGGTGSFALTATAGFDDTRDSTTDTTAAAVTLSLGSSRLGSIETAGDRDIYAVTLTAGQSYTFDLGGSSADGAALLNGELRLLDAAGTALRFNDDFNSASSRIVFTATATATYYLDVRSHVLTGTGTYSVSARAGFDDVRDTLTDTTAAKAAAGVGTPWLGTIETAGDTDLVSVNLVAGKTYMLDLKGSSAAGGALGDGDLQLLTASGMLLAYDGAGGSGTTARIFFTPVQSATYLLNVRGTGMLTGTYALGATEIVDDYRDAIEDISAPFGALTAGGSLSGTIELPGDSDVFAVTLTAGKTYSLTAWGALAGRTLADGDLQLFNSGGTLIAYSDDANGMKDPQILFTASATGTYYLNVRGVSAATGSYLVRAANEIAGTAANDSLTGTATQDNLHGGAGSDSLSGGAAADLFYFETALSAASNVDNILDFSSVDDTLMLSRTIFTAITANGTLAASAFFAGTAAHDADDRVVYNSATGDIFYDADGTGAGAAVLFAHLTPGAALTNLDLQAYMPPG